MGKTVARITMERALTPAVESLPEGVILDIGAKNARYRPLVRATEYLTFDIRPDVGADIVGDVHDLPRESDSLDGVIMTEVLEHCYDPARAVGQIHRVLRSGGVCVLTTRFHHVYHPDPHDYFRFTWDGMAYLFREFSEVEVVPLGNRLHAAWMLVPRRGWLATTFVNLFTPLVAKVDVKNTKNPCGFLVRAVK